MTMPDTREARADLARTVTGVDYSGTSTAAFTLSAAQAAEVIGLAPPDVTDLVRTGRLPALVGADSADGATPPFRLAPDVVTAFADALVQARLDKGTVEILAAGRVLRRYLDQVTPVDDFNEAVELGAPLLARSRSRNVFAHVSAKGFAAAMFRETSILDWKIRVEPSADRVLRALGCVKVRGIRALNAPDKQRWSWWYRVPASIWSLTGPRLDSMIDYPALGGSSRERGEAARGAPDAASGTWVAAPDDFGDRLGER